ncbi:MAG: murein transglycosylase [Proteobacteria bacterium]|nr:murein transglycosylase [Pseudomonadota bacterium]
MLTFPSPHAAHCAISNPITRPNHPLLHSFCLALALALATLFASPFAEAEHNAWDYPPFGENEIALYNAFAASCQKFQAMPAGRQLGGNKTFGTAGQWQAICAQGLAQRPQNLNAYLTSRLARLRLGNTAEEGKFTGYYKPVLQGSRTRHGAYQTPLLARPADLTICNGQTGQLKPNGQCLNPYPTRRDIIGNLAHYKVLLWLKDPVDAYFLHIQGSGAVELDNGTTAHVGFAGKNGHPYVAIGKVLKDMGALSGTITADKIRAWLKAAKPEDAQEVLFSNPSFIFFKETPSESPGAFGVALTAGRSLAVDKSRIPLGLPLFLSTTNTFDDTPWQRIMFAQDVGSAIKGAARGDIYFGQGPLAGQRAGSQNASGKLYALVPKENVGEQAVAKLSNTSLKD